MSSQLPPRPSVVGGGAAAGSHRRASGAPAREGSIVAMMGSSTAHHTNVNNSALGGDAAPGGDNVGDISAISTSSMHHNTTAATAAGGSSSGRLADAHHSNSMSIMMTSPTQGSTTLGGVAKPMTAPSAIGGATAANTSAAAAANAANPFHSNINFSSNSHAYANSSAMHATATDAAGVGGAVTRGGGNPNDTMLPEEFSMLRANTSTNYAAVTSWPETLHERVLRARLAISDLFDVEYDRSNYDRGVLINSSTTTVGQSQSQQSASLIGKKRPSSSGGGSMLVPMPQIPASPSRSASVAAGAGATMVMSQSFEDNNAAPSSIGNTNNASVGVGGVGLNSLSIAQNKAHVKLLRSKVVHILHQLAESMRVDDAVAEGMEEVLRKSNISQNLMASKKGATGAGDSAADASSSLSAPRGMSASNAKNNGGGVKGALSTLKGLQQGSGNMAGDASSLLLPPQLDANARHELIMANMRIKLSEKYKEVEALKAFCIRKDAAIDALRASLLQDVMNLKKENIELQSQTQNTQTALQREKDIAARNQKEMAAAAAAGNGSLALSAVGSAGYASNGAISASTTAGEFGGNTFLTGTPLAGGGGIAPIMAVTPSQTQQLQQVAMREYLTIFDYLRLFEGDDPDPERQEGGALRIAERQHREVVQRLNIDNNNHVLLKETTIELLRKEIEHLKGEVVSAQNKKYTPGDAFLMFRLGLMRASKKVGKGGGGVGSSANSTAAASTMALALKMGQQQQEQEQEQAQQQGTAEEGAAAAKEGSAPAAADEGTEGKAPDDPTAASGDGEQAPAKQRPPPHWDPVANAPFGVNLPEGVIIDAMAPRSGEELEDDLAFLMREFDRKVAECTAVSDKLERERIEYAGSATSDRANLLREQQATEELSGQLEERETECAQLQETVATLQRALADAYSPKRDEKTQQQKAQEMESVLRMNAELQSETIPRITKERDAANAQVVELRIALAKLEAEVGGDDNDDGGAGGGGPGGRKGSAQGPREVAALAKSNALLTKQMQRLEQEARADKQRLEEEKQKAEALSNEVTDLRSEMAMRVRTSSSNNLLARRQSNLRRSSNVSAGTPNGGGDAEMALQIQVGELEDQLMLAKEEKKAQGEEGRRLEQKIAVLEAHLKSATDIAAMDKDGSGGSGGGSAELKSIVFSLQRDNASLHEDKTGLEQKAERLEAKNIDLVNEVQLLRTQLQLEKNRTATVGAPKAVDVLEKSGKKSKSEDKQASSTNAKGGKDKAGGSKPPPPSSTGSKRGTPAVNINSRPLSPNADEEEPGASVGKKKGGTTPPPIDLAATDKALLREENIEASGAMNTATSGSRASSAKQRAIGSPNSNRVTNPHNDLQAETHVVVHTPTQQPLEGEEGGDARRRSSSTTAGPNSTTTTTTKTTTRGPVVRTGSIGGPSSTVVRTTPPPPPPSAAIVQNPPLGGGSSGSASGQQQQRVLSASSVASRGSRGVGVGAADYFYGDDAIRDEDGGDDAAFDRPSSRHSTTVGRPATGAGKQGDHANTDGPSFQGTFYYGAEVEAPPFGGARPAGSASHRSGAMAKGSSSLRAGAGGYGSRPTSGSATPLPTSYYASQPQSQLLTPASNSSLQPPPPPPSSSHQAVGVTPHPSGGTISRTPTPASLATFGPSASSAAAADAVVAGAVGGLSMTPQKGGQPTTATPPPQFVDGVGGAATPVAEGRIGGGGNNRDVNTSTSAAGGAGRGADWARPPSAPPTATDLLTGLPPPRSLSIVNGVGAALLDASLGNISAVSVGGGGSPTATPAPRPLSRSGMGGGGAEGTTTAGKRVPPTSSSSVVPNRVSSGAAIRSGSATIGGTNATVVAASTASSRPPSASVVVAESSRSVLGERNGDLAVSKEKHHSRTPSLAGGGGSGGSAAAKKPSATNTTAATGAKGKGGAATSSSSSGAAANRKTSTIMFNSFAPSAAYDISASASRAPSAGQRGGGGSGGGAVSGGSATPAPAALSPAPQVVSPSPPTVAVVCHTVSTQTEEPPTSSPDALGAATTPQRQPPSASLSSPQQQPKRGVSGGRSPLPPLSSAQQKVGTPSAANTSLLATNIQQQHIAAPQRQDLHPRYSQASRFNTMHHQQSTMGIYGPAAPIPTGGALFLTPEEEAEATSNIFAPSAVLQKYWAMQWVNTHADQFERYFADIKARRGGGGGDGEGEAEGGAFSHSASKVPPTYPSHKGSGIVQQQQRAQTPSAKPSSSSAPSAALLLPMPISSPIVQQHRAASSFGWLSESATTNHAAAKAVKKKAADAETDAEKINHNAIDAVDGAPLDSRIVGGPYYPAISTAPHSHGNSNSHSEDPKRPLVGAIADVERRHGVMTTAEEEGGVVSLAAAAAADVSVPLNPSSTSPNNSRPLSPTAATLATARRASGGGSPPSTPAGGGLPFPPSVLVRTTSGGGTPTSPTDASAAEPPSGGLLDGVSLKVSSRPPSAGKGAAGGRKSSPARRSSPLRGGGGGAAATAASADDGPSSPPAPSWRMVARNAEIAGLRAQVQLDEELRRNARDRQARQLAVAGGRMPPGMGGTANATAAADFSATANVSSSGGGGVTRIRDEVRRLSREDGTDNDTGGAPSHIPFRGVLSSSPATLGAASALPLPPSAAAAAQSASDGHGGDGATVIMNGGVHSSPPFVTSSTSAGGLEPAKERSRTHTTLDIRTLANDIYHVDDLLPEDVAFERKVAAAAAARRIGGASGAGNGDPNGGGLAGKRQQRIAGGSDRSVASVRGVREKVQAQINVAKFMQTFPDLHPLPAQSPNSQAPVKPRR